MDEAELLAKAADVERLVLGFLAVAFFSLGLGIYLIWRVRNEARRSLADLELRTAAALERLEAKVEYVQALVARRNGS